MMATKGDPYLLFGCTAFETRELLDRYLTAFQKVVDRHDILRTAIMWEDLTSPAQVVLRQASLSITELSLDPADGPIIDQLAKLYDARYYRLDLVQAPLIRYTIVQDTDGRWIMAQLMHHIIGDHSTLDIMEEEIQAFMENRGESLPSPQPFRNLIAQARLGVSIEEHESFFRKMLADIETPALPYGLADVHSTNDEVVESHRMLPQDLNDRLRHHAKNLGVSLASLCHLAWAQVIAATSGQQKVVFGTVLFGRMQGGSGSDRAMGLFINTLPLRVDMEDVSIMESVRSVQNDLATLLEHEHASLALAQRCSSVLAGIPLFSAILNYRHNSAPFKQTRISSGMEVLVDRERTNYPFIMSIEDFGSSLGITAQISQPYDSARISGYMHQALQSLAAALEHAPGSPVQTLDILPAEEHNLTIQSWNTTGAPFPNDRCIHQLFEDQVLLSPESVAIVYNGKSLTYRQLNEQANILAHQLIESGIRHGDNVAVLFAKSIDLVMTQLAILKIGAAYVPIDTKAPLDRQVYIINDSASRLLVTDAHMEIPYAVEIPLFRLGPNEVQTANVANVALTGSSQDTAYIMYTSGSTGLPKGVMIPHRAVARLVINSGYVSLGPNDRVAFAANPAFDASTFEVWAPLLNGGQL
ncbi:hypothetical protein BGX28_001061, partial [Mortierella sp. GBA30]